MKTKILISASFLMLFSFISCAQQAKKDVDPFRYKMEDNKLKLEKTYFNIGNAYNTEVKKESTAIFNDTDAPMTITFSGTPTYISMSVSPKVIPAKSKGILTMEYRVAENKKNGEQNWGYQNSRIRLIVNGNTESKRNNLSVRANIQEDYSKLTPKELANAPKISFKETVFNFGETKQGENVVHEFVFTNTGKTDLKIRKVKGSWGCTAVSTTDSAVKKGKTSTIKATFKTKGKKGKQTKSITVTTNDPANPTIVLKMTGTVVIAPKTTSGAPTNKTMAPKASH